MARPVAVEPQPAAPAPVAPLAAAPKPADASSGRPAAQVAEREAERPIPALAVALLAAREERARGEALFFKEWAAHDPASPRGDGLGPMFNETSCVACHGLGGPGGAGPENKNVVILTAISTDGRALPKGLERAHPGLRNGRSAVLHRYGTDPGYASWRASFFVDHRQRAQKAQAGTAEETVETRIGRAAGQASEAGRAVERTTRLKPEPGVTLRVSERNTPALFGSGLIDAIPAEVLILEARSQPAEVRGRVGRVRDGRVGRFGWKAQIGGLHEFVRGACASELGLEVPGHSQPASPLDPLAKAPGIDLGQGDCDALVAYVRALPAPVVVDPDGPRGTPEMREGRRTFAEVGCASCHAPSLGEVRGIYSDLLLHDMGQSLGDSGSSYGIEGPESPGGPSPGEWRTPPLWGFRDSGPYLHDGRAETLEQAVALHGGQAGQSARQFFSLPPADRARVETFLKSLVAPAEAAAPGLVLAAELEARIKPDAVRQAEAQLRQAREEAEAREIRDQAENRRRQLAEVAAKRAPGQLRIAINLEKSGKVAGALEFYRMIARDAPNTKEGRASVGRIAALAPTDGQP